jgi:hypothetical protein
MAEANLFAHDGCGDSIQRTIIFVIDIDGGGLHSQQTPETTYVCTHFGAAIGGVNRCTLSLFRRQHRFREVAPWRKIRARLPCGTGAIVRELKVVSGITPWVGSLAKSSSQADSSAHRPLLTPP